MIAILVLAVAEEKAAAEKDGHSPQSWMRYLHVCGTWRNLLQNKSSIWNEIRATNEDVTQYMLNPRRAQKPAIKACFYGYGEATCEGILRVLKGESSRIRALDLAMPMEMWLSLCHGNPKLWMFDQLESLVVTMPTFWYTHATIPFMVPKLQELRTNGFDLSAIQPLIGPSLKTLVIRDEEPTRKSDVLAALRAAPHLENLTLNVRFWSGIDDSRNPPSVELPCLRYVRVYIESEEHIELLPLLRYPDTASTTFELDCTRYWEESTLVSDVGHIANE
ncbi:hypothetical protein GLOTRDRAFT_131683, partial [Gloeophyllum trabeum ATCC 11539]